MGELWRSQEMQLAQLYIQIEAAHDTVDELGKLGLIEFRDLNPHVNAFQRNFINEVKRADEMERKLRYFASEIDLHNIKTVGTKNKIAVVNAKDDIVETLHMDELETKLDEYEKQIQEMNVGQEALRRNYNQLVELNHVMEKDEVFFSKAGQREDDKTYDIEEGGTTTSKGLGFVTGVIVREKFQLFERILFRVARGNIFMKFAEIAEEIFDPVDSGRLVKKNVFIVFFHGSALEAKIKKICESFFANLYPCPDSPQERKVLLEQVTSRLQDLAVLLEKGSSQRTQILGNIGLYLNSWIQKVKQEKGIYHTMNKFLYDLGRKCLIAEGWFPRCNENDVAACLRRGNVRSNAVVPSIMNIIKAKDEPPTYFKTNKFTSAFQGIVDSYGIARYREINPAVFTIVTFPYEFGIMFGDVGHGFLLFLFAMVLIWKEKDWEGKKIPEMIEMFYGGRYLILLMALFAFYQGWLYNEFFSMPMNFGSAWTLEYGHSFDNSTFSRIDPDPAKTYAFGVDPVWKGATNELLYYNSMKMKMSIIVGVTQMTLGIFLHLINAVYFKQWYDVFFEFLPRVLFLLSIFGYLCFMIIYKWCTDYHGQDLANRNFTATMTPEQISNLSTNTLFKGTSKAPVLLNELIFMVLPPPPGELDNLYAGQSRVQGILVVIAFLCVPIMMCVKPLLLLRDNNKRKKHAASAMQNLDFQDNSHKDGTGSSVVHHIDGVVEDVDPVLSEDGHGHGEFEFSEIMVHQSLETIEFVLGSVSHTASYLRLWALSLAHSELATVFWGKVMFTLLSLPSGHGMSFVATAFCVFIGQSVWFFITLLVMMFMEGLSAFLHALRLHWVEFQSKFYKGDGHLFQPFSYSKLDTENE